jgi:hypothetical protein
MIGRGIWMGLGVFALLAALAYLTPLRAPVLRAAGETYPSLQHRFETQRRTLDTLQMQASNAPLSPARQNLFAQTQRDFAASQQLLESWEKGQARLSLFGFVSWCLDLFPWLAAFGLALPILGGLIGAQVAPRAPKREPEPYPENPPSVPVTPARPVPPRAQPQAAPAPPRHPAPAEAPAPAPRVETPPVPKPDFDRIGKPAFRDDPAELARHPALEASRPPRPAPPPAPPATEPPAQSTAQAGDWGFRHQPTPTEGRRPPAPPVRSPHAFDSDVPPGSEA